MINTVHAAHAGIAHHTAAAGQAPKDVNGHVNGDAKHEFDRFLAEVLVRIEEASAAGASGLGPHDGRQAPAVPHAPGIAVRASR